MLAEDHSALWNAESNVSGYPLPQVQLDELRREGEYRLGASQVARLLRSHKGLTSWGQTPLGWSCSETAYEIAAALESDKWSLIRITRCDWLVLLELCLMGGADGLESCNMQRMDFTPWPPVVAELLKFGQSAIPNIPRLTVTCARLIAREQHAFGPLPPAAARWVARASGGLVFDPGRMSPHDPWTAPSEPTVGLPSSAYYLIITPAI